MACFERRLGAKRVLRELSETRRATGDEKPTIAPTPTGGRSANALRPDTLHGMVGQVKLRRLVVRLTDAPHARPAPLDHMLLVGSSGMGKTTVANAVANALGVQVWQIEAPVSHDTLTTLR